MNGLPTTFRVIDSAPGLLVVYKCPGVGIHDDESGPGLMTWLREELGQKVYPIHRLDRDTSGVLLVGTNKETTSIMSQQFAESKIRKMYWAIAKGKPKKKQGWIKGDMVPARRGSWRLSKTLNNPAITHFTSFSVAPSVRLYRLSPCTGKTHQLRVVCKALGVPILGDKRYGGEDADRMYLHAHAVSFYLNGSQHYYQSFPFEGEHFLDSNIKNCIEAHPLSISESHEA